MTNIINNTIKIARIMTEQVAVQPRYRNLLPVKEELFSSACSEQSCGLFSPIFNEKERHFARG